MSRRMSSSEFQRKEFEKELGKALTVIGHDFDLDNAYLNEDKAKKRILRAYNIAEMRTALREEQQGGE